MCADEGVGEPLQVYVPAKKVILIIIIIKHVRFDITSAERGSVERVFRVQGVS